VVDNGASAATHQAVEEARGEGLRITLLVPGENLGPAGGTSLAMREVLQSADDDAWITRLDDDLDALPPALLERLVETADDLRRTDPSIGAVGTAGARFDERRARLTRPHFSVAETAVDVDYVTTNFFPLFSVGAVRRVGEFDASLFYGLSEVEFGLRLRDAGYRVIVSTALREMTGRIDRRQRPTRLTLRAPSWRQYYGLRNLIVLLRRRGHPWIACRVALVRGILKPILNLPLTPSIALATLRLNAHAISDGFRGRLGRRFGPGDLTHAPDTDYETEL
jgi:hypothetical protein